MRDVRTGKRRLGRSAAAALVVTAVLAFLVTPAIAGIDGLFSDVGQQYVAQIPLPLIPFVIVAGTVLLKLVNNGLTTLQINSNYTDMAITADRLRARNVARRG